MSLHLRLDLAETAASLAASGYKLNEIAREIGVSPGLIRDYLHSPEGRECVAKMRVERTETVLRKLESLRDVAIDVHRMAMQDGDLKIKLRAAQSVLDRAGAPQETRVDNTPAAPKSMEEARERLAVLKAKLEGSDGGSESGGSGS